MATVDTVLLSEWLSDVDAASKSWTTAISAAKSFGLSEDEQQKLQMDADLARASYHHAMTNLVHKLRTLVETAE